MLDNFGRKVIIPAILPKDWAPGWNNDKRKCKRCQYRGLKCQQGTKNGCDYIEHARHSRGCRIEDCFRYIRGKRLLINTRGANREDEEGEYAD